MERRRLTQPPPQGVLNAGHLEPPPQPISPVEGSERNRNENGRNVTAGSGNGNGNPPSERSRNENGAPRGAPRWRRESPRACKAATSARINWPN